MFYNIFFIFCFNFVVNIFMSINNLILDTCLLAIYKSINFFFFICDIFINLVTVFYNTHLLHINNILPYSYDLNISLLVGLSFASLLFFIGLFGVLWNKKNIIIMFLCIELMLFGAGVLFLIYWLFFNFSFGTIFALLILTIATAETAIGLSIIILAYRLNRSISFETFTNLKG